MKGGFFSLGIYSNEQRLLNKEDLLRKLYFKNVKIDIIEDKRLLDDMIDYISYSTIAKGLKSTNLVDNNGNFINKISPKELLLFHKINMDISSLLFKYVLFIEQSLNSTLSNIISKKFGTDTSKNLEDINNPNDYLFKGNYVENEESIKILKKIKNHILNPTKYTSLEYYVKNKNYFPPWIVLNSIYLSDSINLYKIMKSADKTDVVNTLLKINNAESDENYIKVKKELFASFFNTIKMYRNKLAHPTVLLKHPIPKQLIFYQVREYSNYTLLYNRSSEKKYRTSIVFSLILSILPLLNLFDISINFYLDINLFLDKYKESNILDNDIFELLNLPKDLSNRILKFISYKYDILIA